VIPLTSRDSLGVLATRVRDDDAMELADRILELLGQGLANSVVASAVGCEPSYISQLLEDSEFRLRVQELRAGKAEAAVKRDTSWDTIEQAALDRASSLVNLVSRPTDLIRIAHMANSAKRASKELVNNDSTGAPVVQLVMPANATIHFQMNTSSQVVEVNGRSLASMPVQQLTKQLADRRAQRLEHNPGDVLDVPTTVHTERKKIVSTLEAIGFADEPVPVPSILAQIS
jgi:hypothetical protein